MLQVKPEVTNYYEITGGLVRVFFGEEMVVEFTSENLREFTAIKVTKGEVVIFQYSWIAEKEPIGSILDCRVWLMAALSFICIDSDTDQFVGLFGLVNLALKGSVREG